MTILLLHPVVNISHLTWWPGDPNGEDIERCVWLRRNPSWLIADTNCDTSEYCFVCRFDSNVPFVLRGLCKSSPVGNNFILKVDESFNNRMVFIGYINGSIYYNNLLRSWVIYNSFNSLNDNNILATLKDDSPVGMKLWNATNIGCGRNGGIFNLKFTQVKYESVYS